MWHSPARHVIYLTSVFIDTVKYIAFTLTEPLISWALKARAKEAKTSVRDMLSELGSQCFPPARPLAIYFPIHVRKSDLGFGAGG